MAVLVVDLDRAPTELDGLGRAADEDVLRRGSGQQLGAGLGHEPVGIAQRPVVLRGGFAVRADRGSALRSGGGEADHGLGVAGGVGVVGKARQVARPAGWGRERRQGGALQGPPAIGRHRLLHGHACELVAKGDTLAVGRQHARTQAGLKRRQLVGSERLEKPQLRRSRADSDRLEQALRRPGQPAHARKDRIAHRLRDTRGGAGQRLGHEERVAAGQAIQLGRVDVVPRCQQPHRGLRQALDPHAPDRSFPRELPEHAPKRVSRVKIVVTVARDHKRADPVHLPRDDPDDVKRCLIRPVQVLQHHDCRAPAELVQERLGDVKRL